MKKLSFNNVLYMLSFIVMFIVIITLSIFKEGKDDMKHVIIEGTEQTFPIEVYHNYLITNANIENETLSITLERDGEIYESSIPMFIISNIVCGQNIEKRVYWDCTDGQSIIHSMIQELGFQTVQLLNENDVD